MVTIFVSGVGNLDRFTMFVKILIFALDNPCVLIGQMSLMFNVDMIALFNGIFVILGIVFMILLDDVGMMVFMVVMMIIVMFLMMMVIVMFLMMMIIVMFLMMFVVIMIISKGDGQEASHKYNLIENFNFEKICYCNKVQKILTVNFILAVEIVYS